MEVGYSCAVVYKAMDITYLLLTGSGTIGCMIYLGMEAALKHIAAVSSKVAPMGLSCRRLT